MNNMRLKNMVEYLTTMVKDGCDKDTKSGFFLCETPEKEETEIMFKCHNIILCSCKTR